jgi:5-methylcytosine-specific restriction endonuclease McrA
MRSSLSVFRRTVLRQIASRQPLRGQRVLNPPPEPGAWANFAAYYRIPLQKYSRLAYQPLLREIEDDNFDSIRQDIFPNRPKHHPYATYGSGVRIAQGLYLGKLTNRLVEIFDVYTGRLAADPSEARTSIKEYQEGEAYRSERTFFARNATLRDDAIKAHGLRCVVCNFDFKQIYGQVGTGFIEVHHLHPLSLAAQKAGSTPSVTVDDVRPLCANCHRMAHRRQPPFSIEELKAAIGTAQSQSF